MKKFIQCGLLLGGLALLCLWVGCRKDDAISQTLPDTLVKATFSGQILDEQNNPLQNAQVRIGAKVVLTDENGVYLIRNAEVKNRHANVQVSKIGFFNTSRLMSVLDGSSQHTVIQLQKKNFVDIGFAANQGGVFQAVTNGPSIKFPANAFKVSSGGSAYTGNVRIAVSHIDPSDPDFGIQIPGALRGLRSNGEEQVLASFGMLYVELEGENGQELNLAAGQSAEITMPIPANLQSTAPDEIPLWYFDTSDGLWKEEGSAKKSGTQYIGSVTHFSCWNYDGSLPSIEISGQVVDQNGNPLAGITVRIQDIGTGWNVGYGNTDADGKFIGPVAKDVPLKMKVTYFNYLSNCGEVVIIEQNIGPFSVNTALPTIVVDLSTLGSTQETINISANLTDCFDQTLSNGYLKVSINGAVYRSLIPDANGDVSATILYCNPTDVALSAIDIGTLQKSADLTYTTAPFNIQAGTIKACGTQLDEYVNYILDGGQQVTSAEPYFWSQGGYSQISTDGQANYIYFGFQNNDQTGTFPLTNFTVSGINDSIPATSITTNVIEFGLNQGEFVRGTFGGTATSSNGTVHTISGSYKVKRD